MENTKKYWMAVLSKEHTMRGVIDQNVYQHQMSENFIPFRRNVKFLDCGENDFELISKKMIKDGR